MTTESSIRRRAKRMGYVVWKSREWKYVPHSNNFGEYVLVNDRNCVMLGDRFDATLEDIERFLNDVAGGEAA